MEDKRSRSYADNGMQIESYGYRGPPPPSFDPRSFNTSHASSYSQKEMRLKKVKGSCSFKGGWFNDPEVQRRKRIAGYKIYSVEGKVKGSLKNSIRWLKDKYYQVVYGWC
ncbi:hypothetical protein M5K25_022524 [Dendrobium thyrsiflorum]|uniref:Uncharacterized protein n=1 Tax=Dendrobium thyrsiflorum TaxID=117978 RepID=A0ABD0U6D2_DENTH